MSKLFKLREWLTVEEAAKRLSINSGEEVTEADILRLALDGQLTLSVYFVNHAVARRGEIVPFHETNWILIPPLFKHPDVVLIEDEADKPAVIAPWKLQKLWHENPKGKEQGLVPIMTSLAVGPNEDQYINLEEDIFHITGGVWDLPLIGNEHLDIEHAYQQKTNGIAVTIQGIDGAFVRDDKYFYQLQESHEDNPHMAGSRASFEWLAQLTHKHKDQKVREEAKELLGQHGDNRNTFLEERNRYYPAGGLPDDSVLVVRTSALRALEEKLLADNRPPEKPLHPSERKSTGQIIATLAAMAGLDLSTPYKAVDPLRAAAAVHGLELPGSDETIVKFLKDAADRSGKD